MSYIDLDFVIKIAFGVSIFFASFAIGKWVANIMRNKVIKESWEDVRYATRFGDVVFDISQRLIIILGFYISMDILGINLGFLIGGVSFGLGFGLYQILGNMLAGIIILTNHKYKIGDTVQIMGGSKSFGKIEDISIRYTVIRLFDHRRIIIPNISMLTSAVQTYNIEKTIRSEIIGYIGFNTDISQVCQDLKTVVNNHPKIILADSTKVFCNGSFPSGFNITMQFYYNPAKGSALSIKSDLRKAFIKYTDDNNIDFPRDHETWIIHK